MANLKKYNLEGKEIGAVSVAEPLLNAKANGQMIKDYIVALRANARQWSANTKTRAEVNHTTKKPHPQKGGGRARQGALSAPQYKGGGRVFGPRPKFDQHIRVNKKEKQAALRFLISEKIHEGRIAIIDSIDMEGPKTKTVAQFIKERSLGKRVLFLAEGSYVEVEIADVVNKISVRSNKHENFVRSASNIPKVEFSLVSNINGYDLVKAHDIVMTESAFHELTEWLCPKSKV